MLRPTRQTASLTRERNTLCPGITKVLYLPIESLTADPSSFDALGNISAIPSTAAKWNVAHFIMQGVEHTETQAINDLGDIFEEAVTGVLPFDEKTNHIILNQLMHQRFIVLVYSNGIVKWLGSKENPCKLVHNYGSGSRKNGSSANTTISFVWRTAHKPLILAATVSSGNIQQ